MIGNQNYRRIEPLATPINDAHRAAQVLREDYGFTVTVVDDADDVAMLRALNDLNGILQTRGQPPDLLRGPRHPSAYR